MNKPLQRINKRTILRPFLFYLLLNKAVVSSKAIIGNNGFQRLKSGISQVNDVDAIEEAVRQFAKYANSNLLETR